jgi:hypothetical protein
MLSATGFSQGGFSTHAQRACGYQVTAITLGPKNEFTGYFRSRRPRTMAQTSRLGGGRPPPQPDRLADDHRAVDTGQRHPFTHVRRIL